MNKYFKISVLLSAIFAFFLVSCSEPSKTVVETDKSLVDQIGELTPSQVVSFDELAGDTNTEKLMYLMDLPNSLKSATLIILDTQIKSFETTGDKKTANNLRENRALLIQAADEKMSAYVKEVAVIYDEIFTQEEINILIELNLKPVMRKVIDTQLTVQQKIIPIAETWGNDVGVRYGELIKENAKKKK